MDPGQPPIHDPTGPDSSQESWSQVKEQFQRLLELSADRQAEELVLLERTAPEVAREVRELLEVDARSGNFLDRPPGETGAAAGQDARPGELLGAYRILRPIAAGGMGSVWLAERADGSFERHVAMKLMRQGLSTPSAADRFTRERQLLAQLDHPHIAGLLDGGVSKDQRPYLVMEYVDGTDLLSYCRERGLGLAQRLHLFRQVCEAVHYAHQHLIIHRDLKPSNILVAADGTAKLLDFGIAKVDDPDTDSAATGTGERLLTPQYASPEQVRGESMTTATDVYSLGVILYELLTGCSPYPVDRGQRTELEHHICDKVPAAPSQAVRRPRESSAGPPTDRSGFAQPAFARALRGDLDTIALMCLRKEPERRYASARQIRNDLDRYLRGLPIQARKDTATYRAGKFIHRNPWLAASLVTIFVLSVTAAVVGTDLAAKAEEARGRAAEGETAATLAKEAAEASERTATLEKENAERELKRSEAVRNYLVQVLRKADPSAMDGQELTVREALERSAHHLEVHFEDDRETQAAVHGQLHELYHSVGDFPKSLDHAQREHTIQQALWGERDFRTLGAVDRVASALRGMRRYEEVAAWLGPAVGIARELPTHTPSDVRTQATLLIALADTEERRGNQESARELYEEALETIQTLQRFGSRYENTRNDTTASILTGLGTLQKDDLPAALDHLGRAVAIRRGINPDSTSLATSVHQLAWVQSQHGNFKEAQAGFEEAWQIRREILGRRHYSSVASQRFLGGVVLSQGEAFRGARLIREATQLAREIDSPRLDLETWERDVERLEDYVRSRLKKALARLEDDDLDERKEASTRYEAGDSLAATNDYEGALTHLEQGLELAWLADDLDALLITRLAERFADCHRELGTPGEGAAAVREALDILSLPAESEYSLRLQKKLRALSEN